MKGKWRPLLIGGAIAFTLAQIVILSPSSLEQSGSAPVKPEELLPDSEGDSTLAVGIPAEKIPEYSIDRFHYVSAQGSMKQWKLRARRAFLYNAEKLVHARRIIAHLYDPEGKVTVVTGREAKYFMDRRDLEIFGDVESTFPDGFRVKSEYLRYLPAQRKIEIPNQYSVVGSSEPPPPISTGSPANDADSEGDPDLAAEKADLAARGTAPAGSADSQSLGFQSYGFDYAMATGQITLPTRARVTMRRQGPKKAENQGVADETTIDSDRCVILRNRNIAHFTMNAGRPADKRFVLINQPTLFARGRRADLRYGDFANVLQYMTVYEDVLIREKESAEGGSSRYGTSGRADFDTRQDVIVLREFPQVYQDNDTVTGEVIIVHRDTDIVEVDHSNAYSEGEQQPKQ